MLGCPVRVGAVSSGVVMPREAWHIPMRRRDEIAYLVGYSELAAFRGFKRWTGTTPHTYRERLRGGN